jgi:Spy/CpxP family protein refolding chaperone
MIKAKLIFTSCLFVLIFTTLVRTDVAQANQNLGDITDSAHTLSETQKQAIKRIQAESEKRAAPVALRLAGIVCKIYENMLTDKPDEELRTRLSAEMKEATWELLSIKGQSIREIVNVLTPEQKQVIRKEMGKEGAPADLSEIITRTFKLSGK